MTAFIIMIELALFMVLVGFTWYRLEAYDGIKRIGICILGVIISAIITKILFSISSNGISYITSEVAGKVSKILVLIFTPINGIIIMPYTAKIISEIKFNEFEQKDLKRKLIILTIVLIIVFFLEIQYLRYIQLGILKIASAIK